jgi:hypothetical protein
VGAALFVTGAQVVSSSFFLSLFSIEPVSGEAEAPIYASPTLATGPLWHSIGATIAASASPTLRKRSRWRRSTRA